MKKPPFFEDSDIISAMRGLNPWWSNQGFLGLPNHERSPFESIKKLLQTPNFKRGIFLAGPRGVGKTTLLLHTAQFLIKERGIPARQVVFLSFENKFLRYTPWSDWFALWDHHFRTDQPPTYFLLDEIQYASPWADDLLPLLQDSRYRFIVTGSSSAAINTHLQAQVRRWIHVPVLPLSFYESLRLFSPELETEVNALCPASWEALGQRETLEPALTTVEKLEPAWKTYLLRGGFPEMSRPLDLPMVQKLMNDDVDRALFQDMKITFRRHDIENLERLFLYICEYPGLLLDKSKVAALLEVPRQTVARYLQALESAHLVFSLPNVRTQGKSALVAKPKVYPADSSLRNAIKGRNETLFENADEMGSVLETAVATHLWSFAIAQNAKLGYWRLKDRQEIDFVFTTPDNKVTLVEAKAGTDRRRFLAACQLFPHPEKIHQRFLITRYSTPAGIFSPLIIIPAPLFAYVLGKSIHAS